MNEPTLAGTLAIAFTAATFAVMAFFSFVVAPSAFRALEKEQAGAFVRRVFPVYYLVMAVTAAIAGWLATGQGVFEALLLSGVAVVFVALNAGLRPVMERRRRQARAGDAGAEASFRRLHGLSMVVNLVQFVVVTIVLFRLAG